MTVVMDELLAVDGLSVTYTSRRDSANEAVADTSFVVPAGRTVALVGESGSGKSTTALAIMRLLPARKTRIQARRLILHDDTEAIDLLSQGEKRLRRLRGSTMAMIFQQPQTCMNPLLTVGRQITESLQLHSSLSKKDASGRAIELLEEVGIADAGRRVDCFPHQFSGGMLQRIMIAVALAGKPKLLIADEATSGLDASVQRQILCLLRDVQERLGTAILLITHDMGVVAAMADYVCVLDRGRTVEAGDVSSIFGSARHVVTRRLLQAAQRKL